MKDWSLNSPTLESYNGYISWHQKDSNDAYECRRAGFELFEKRYPLSHKQPNMESDCYYYFRKYRN